MKETDFAGVASFPRYTQLLKVNIYYNMYISLTIREILQKMDIEHI